MGGCRTDAPPLVPSVWERDRQPHFDATSCLVVPPLPFEKRKRYVYADLQKIAGILRAPDGCPWDAEQTHFSLKSAMLEEACEAIAAVDERGTWSTYARSWAMCCCRWR